MLTSETLKYYFAMSIQMTTRFHPRATMPHLTHIIWDWNGTLFDDAWLCREILNELLAARNLPTVDAARYQEVFGFPVQEYYRKVGFNFDSEPFEVPAHEFIDKYETRRLECRIRPDTRMVLSAIRDAGLNQSVLSAYEQTTLTEIVDHFHLTNFFKEIRGLDNPYAAGKIDLGRQMLSEMSLEPSRVVLVGDTTHDNDVARSLGIGAILVPGGHHSKLRLQQCGVPVVDGLEEVVKIVTEKSKG